MMINGSISFLLKTEVKYKIAYKMNINIDF